MEDAVAGEIEVNSEDYEPLDYEDAVDDALNATIHTVRFTGLGWKRVKII